MDYLIKVKGYSFLEAVETIIGHTAIQAPVYEKPQAKEENKPLLLPEKCVSNRVITEYLEAFLRHLLLNEKNELHNRNLHISGLLNEEKVDIQDGKVDIWIGEDFILEYTSSPERVGEAFKDGLKLKK